MYTEASSKSRRIAILETRTSYQADGEDKCLSFWLHMFGTDMGSLSVLQGDHNNQTQLFIAPSKLTFRTYEQSDWQ